MERELDDYYVRMVQDRHESIDLAIENIANRTKKNSKNIERVINIKKTAFIAAMTAASIIGIGTAWYGSIVKKTVKDIKNSQCLEQTYKGVPLSKIITTPTSRGVTVYINGKEDDIYKVIDAYDEAIIGAGYTEDQAAICEEEYLGVNKQHSILKVIKDYDEMDKKGEMYYSGNRYQDSNPKGR